MELPPSLVTELRQAAAGPLDMRMGATLPAVGTGLPAVAVGLLGEQVVVADGLNLLRRGMEPQALEVTAATAGEYQLKVVTVLLLMVGMVALESSWLPRKARKEGQERRKGK